MRGHGKHRRPKNAPLARGLVVVGITGSAALALPLAGATGAAAQPAQATPSAAAFHSVAVEKTAAVKAVQAGQKSSLVHYSVVAGDSLSKIARKHHVGGGWKKIYRDNRAAVGDDPGLIRPGLKLTFTAKGAAPGATTRTATARTAEARPAAASSSARSVTAQPAAVVQAAAPAKAAAATSYANNLDGWIRESLAIMAKNGIPGTYDGIYRNVMRESSGNPLAVNNWDSNALAGTPSKGLLQVIEPTFQAYHVPGTAYDLFDPVANITAACNYAAARYGSIDNVFGAY